MRDSYVLVCNECFELVAKESPASAQFWMNLCAVAGSSNDTIVIENRRLPFLEHHIERLERLRFIATHETNRAMLLRLLGTHDEFFCVHISEHEDDDDCD